MDNKLRQTYLDHFGIKKHEFLVPEIPCDDVAVVDGEKKALLSAIYAVDPKTGFPTGDIACYVSSNTSPEVKKYILDNIMIDTSSAALPSIPDGIDDETAFALTRQADESLDSYMNRLNEFTDKQVRLRDSLVEIDRRTSSKSQEE